MAVSGDVVAGWAYNVNGRSRSGHAFAYDLGAASPAMVDLGTLGGSNSAATAVRAHVVVGFSYTAGNEEHAFAYDLASPSPTMRDLGTLGGTSSHAAPVSGSVVVVGSSTTAGGIESHAFAYDLSAPQRAMRDLGRLGSGGDGPPGRGFARVVGGGGPAV
jgi:probable HAF family extracellular repeat protein